jgi:PAS domain S-box-containing protein
LLASERRYRDVVESQADLVCRFLPDGTLSFVNEAFCRAFQRGREVLVGSSFFALLPEATRAVARAQIERETRQGERSEWECEVALPGARVGWQRWLCHPVDGPHEEFQAICHDITDRKRAEEADRSLTHASRMAVMGELTAMVAHEVRQPLTAILTNADAAAMLLASADPPLDELREILADIRSSDLQANEAILRVRALVQNREISLQPVDVNAVIVDVLRLTAGDLLRRQVVVRTELDPSLPHVAADGSYLRQVVLNLVVNAMDAMDDTPARSRVVTLRTRCDGAAAIEVVVADRGHGIAPSKLAAVFESFFTTKSEGMGLGLSIARSIVRSHGGRIWAENQAEGGAALHFTLNVREQAESR